MRPTSKTLLRFACDLSFLALPVVAITPASAQFPAPAASSAPAPASAPLPALPPATMVPTPVRTGRAIPLDSPVRPASMTAPAASSSSPVRAAASSSSPVRAASSTPAAYWGPAPPVAPKRKPTAVGRFFDRIGNFIGVNEDMGTIPVYRDPTTGRTNTGVSKPWMKRLPE